VIRTVALASGSNGNSVWVETPDARLLFDAGVSGKHLAARAAARGVDLDRIDGLILSHDHSDHTSGAGVIHRRHGIPIHATQGTWASIHRRMGRARALTFVAGETLRFGKTVVETIPTPHDGTDGVCFVVTHGGLRLGVLTDLGHPFGRLLDAFGTLDGAFLEANYDPEMLRTGPYPLQLQERIAGDGGHLSNGECVEIAREAANGRLRWLALCHLSGENNTPDRALAAADGLAAAGIEVHLAGRHAASDLLELTE
jgi:phosphoribosyl 1,2-cyclic phosphodiesterase